MKRTLFMAVLALLTLALPTAAFANANSVDFTNSGGVLSGSSAGLSLTGSELVIINGMNGIGRVTGDLGSVTFTTGALLSGSVQGQNGSATIFAGGGSFVIMGNGANGAPSGVIFNGSFSGPVEWTLLTKANGTHSYTLMGTLVGTWFNGTTVNGATIQLSISTGKNFFNGALNFSSGDTNISTVPEPGTLGLLGTGLVGLAGVLRKKKK